jgi:hypothetical protein
MKFSYSAVWSDTVGLIRANATILAAIAGVFVFLPALLLAYFLPQPQTAQPDEALRVMMEYLNEVWPWHLLANVVGMVGAIAMLLLLLGRRGTTVGGLIATALAILPFYLLASICSGILLVIGFILLFVPGFYLIGRLAPVGPVVVAEGRRNPIDVIQRALQLTKGKGWAVTGLVLLVAIAGSILSLAVTAVLGIVLALVGGDIGRFLILVLQALGGAVLTTVLIALLAAIYRALSESAAAVFD